MSASGKTDDAPGKGVRLGVTGASHWHLISTSPADSNYLQQIRLSGAELVGVHDEDEATAKRIGEELGVPWTTEVGELVTRCRPDFALALSRPDNAESQVGTLLNLGVPMLAEKPLGRRATEVWPLVERAEKGWVSVAFTQRYLPFWDVIERLQQDGQFGEVAHAGVRQINGLPTRYVEAGVAWMLDPDVAGGGPLRNLGIHSADLMVKLMGENKIHVKGALKTHHMNKLPIEDYITGIGQTDGGAIISLAAGYTYSRVKPNDLDIHVAARHVYLRQRSEGLTVAPMNEPAEFYPAAPGVHLYRTVFFDALRRWRAGQPPKATVRDCARASELLDEIYDAAG